MSLKHHLWYFNHYQPLCVAVFDGPLGEQASQQHDPVYSLLGEAEFDLLQKLHEIIKAKPEKAQILYEKFRDILIEEKKEDVFFKHSPVLSHQDEWDANQRSESRPPGSGSVKMIHKRSIKTKKEEKSFKKKES